MGYCSSPDAAKGIAMLEAIAWRGGRPQPPQPPTAMDRCRQAYGMAFRYEINPTQRHDGQKAEADLALMYCGGGDMTKGMDMLGEILSRGHLPMPGR